jgi:SAM-dependent methyltransferase
MPGREDWWNAAATESDDDLRERILTGFKSGKPFTPYAPTIGWPRVESVLDFGCGVGRSFSYLRSVARTISGFDLPPMIARCRRLAPDGVTLRDDWPALRRERFDLVYASLVLQHVETDAIRACLADFAKMAPAIYLLTRVDSDFGANVLDLVAEEPRLRPGPCHEVEHDYGTHQLRVLGRPSFDEARTAGPGRHFEILLTSAS